jgi:cell division protein FtsL
MPLLLFTALLVMTFVGIARVKARISVLALADEISSLTRERDELLDRKRRLEAERAYLRHPEHVRERATEDLGMIPATPERIQTIQLIEGKD